MYFFTRIDHARNISRFWLSLVTPTIFGGWSLLREWGRIGSSGTVRLATFAREEEAKRAGAARLRGVPPPHASSRCCVGPGRAARSLGKYSRGLAQLKNQVQNGELPGGRAAGRFRLCGHLK
jgi:predicted DNA-binding WGR domain protein